MTRSLPDLYPAPVLHKTRRRRRRRMRANCLMYCTCHMNNALLYSTSSFSYIYLLVQSHQWPWLDPVLQSRCL